MRSMCILATIALFASIADVRTKELRGSPATDAKDSVAPMGTGSGPPAEATTRRAEGPCGGGASADDTNAWSLERIDTRVRIQSTQAKGRCLFTKVDLEPGEVIFVEKPLFVAKPSQAPQPIS
eukprot:gnl/TRDRNA2_/TRDRNA2_128953_c2_seq1.p1 gnl/TRDRNA2_/TRDRNA2_128953_c2~~gnl/TRDRNA2_/TRDRNA2_128953_c2_seq1.p1  ORF type:complete len:123 (-),score=22.35 gnl/TRDRNA2_/TRDRNA2_128953_c2_seq1:305-673(-)